MADIFVSHSSADNNVAETLQAWLGRDRESWTVFLDKDAHTGILAGQDWQKRLGRELSSCRLVLAVMTPDWLDSRWCFTEAVTADFRGKVFVAVLPQALADDMFAGAPPIVHRQQRHLLDLATGQGWDTLLHALDRSGLDPNKWFPNPAGPYPGFVSFEEKDAGVYFGRDAEITQGLAAVNLLKNPDRAQALAIVGGSGTGKSSLLKAGLIPRLRRQPDWAVIEAFDPTREPVHGFLKGLQDCAAKAGVRSTLSDLAEAKVDELTKEVDDALRKIEEATRGWVLLPLDQAETLVAGGDAVATKASSRLIEAVGRLLGGRRRKLIAVFTIRTEYLPALESALRPSAVRLEQLPLGPITALAEVIEKPAARFGIELEPCLAPLMAEDTRGPEALPLLAYTLKQLNDGFGDDKKLTIVEYKALGGVEGAIRTKLAEVLSDPPPSAAEEAALRRSFVRYLIRVDEAGVEGARYLRSQVEKDLLPTAAARLVKRLTDYRLIVEAADGTVALVHDQLIRNWLGLPILQWLNEYADDRRLIDTLQSRLEEHEKGGPLLTGKSLLDARDLLARDPALGTEEPNLASFIGASSDAERSQRRRVKWLFVGSSTAALVFLVVALVAGFFYREANIQTQRAESQALLAQTQTREAQTKESLLLAQLAQGQIEAGDAVTGMLLALRAVPQQEPSERPLVWEARDALVKGSWRQRERLDLHGHEGWVESVAYSLDGLRIVSGSLDGTLRLWAAATGAPIGEPLTGHGGRVYSVAFSLDGRRLVSGGQDGTLRLWDVATGAPIGEPLIGHEGRVYSVAFSPDGRRLVSGGYDLMLRLWDAATGAPLGEPLAGHEGRILSVAYSPDGRRIVSGGNDRTLRLWDATTGAPIGEPFTGHADFVRSVAFSPDSHWIVSGSQDGTLRLWETETGAHIGEPLTDDRGWVTSVAFSPDGRSLVSGSDDGTVRLWDVVTGAPIGEPLSGHEDVVWSVAFSPDGRHLVSGGGDRTLRLWDAATGVPIGEPLAGRRDKVLSIAYSPDGRRLVSGSDDGTLRLWDSATGAPIGEPLTGHGGWVTSVAYSPDGRHLVSGGEDSTLRLWEVATGAPIGEPLTSHGGWVTSVAYSPDGRRLVSGGEDGTLRLWNAATMAPVGEPLAGHKAYVTSVAFSPDGRRLVSGSGDRKLRLWEAATGAPIGGPISGHEGDVLSVAFSPDGKRLVSGGDDGTVRLWDGRDLATLIADAKAALPRCLTLDQERAFFLRAADEDTPVDSEGCKK